MVDVLFNDVVLRMVMAAAIGAIIGLEREFLGVSPGFRAHALVCLGAAIFTIASIQFTSIDPSASLPGAASGVVTGIGFLGAGAIFSDKKGIHKGFTTATNIWVVASLGMIIGIGQILMAVVATVLVLIILAIGKLLETKVIRKRIF